MDFYPPLIRATLLRRYKRFLADVSLKDGSELTVHCPNTGSMKNCIVENSPCYLLDAQNPKRKYRYSWELATVPGGHLAGINTARANTLVEEAIRCGDITELAGYSSLLREQKYGNEGSRVDFLLEREGERCYVEVKSVTLGEQNGAGRFPDAKSDRARKHLRELMVMRNLGCRSVLLFCVQHSGINTVAPADDIDPAYGNVLREAVIAGVEVLAYRVAISPQSLRIHQSLSVLLGS